MKLPVGLQALVQDTRTDVLVDAALIGVEFATVEDQYLARKRFELILDVYLDALRTRERAAQRFARHLAQAGEG